MSNTPVIRKILDYLIAENKVTAEEAVALKPDTDLIEEGVIDSMSILELLVFIEGEFSISLENVSVNAADMKNFASIEAFIEKCKG
jgi:acyl carrier protein